MIDVVKAAKVIALSLTFLPLTGCAIATGLIFASLLKVNKQRHF